MGLISTLPNGDKLYYSAANQPVTIQKEILSNLAIYSGGEHLTRETGTIPTSNITGYNTIWHYVVTGHLGVWNNQTDYTNKNTSAIINTVNIKSTSNTVPENGYSAVYSKLKIEMGYINASYTDDI
jgi:hypothetical protein|tara:strand:+ start:131 stop:508 length:378 start_codon:yes stop_codon:yes gene_type:complete